MPARSARSAACSGRAPSALDRHIAMIAGTSTCHMALSLEPRAVPGVWGPYYGAVAPGLWLNEGGQSATGALLDHILAWHAEGRALGPDGHARILRRIAGAARQGRRGLRRRACTCCPTSTATARRSPTRTRPA